MADDQEPVAPLSLEEGEFILRKALCALAARNGGILLLTIEELNAAPGELSVTKMSAEEMVAISVPPTLN